MMQAAAMTAAAGPLTREPFRAGLYRRITSDSGLDARIVRIGIRSLEGGRGRTCAARRSRIGMLAIVASLVAGLAGIAVVRRNAADP
jgi:hypothetical protein